MWAMPVRNLESPKQTLITDLLLTTYCLLLTAYCLLLTAYFRRWRAT